MNEQEVGLIDYLRVIRKRYRLIVGGTLACMLAALVMSLLLPKVYETNLNLKIGQVWEKPIDDPYRVAAIINSEPFLDKVRQKIGLAETAYQMKRDKIVMAKVIEAARQSIDRPPILVEIVTEAHSPEKTVELAKAVAELFVQEHKPRFDEIMNEHHQYEKELENQTQIIQKETQALDATLKSQRTNPQVSAVAVILLQAQLEQKQSQLVGFIKELRDVKINNTSKARTENTRVIFPPVLPEVPVSLRLSLNNIVIAGIMGLIVFIMVAFFVEYLAQIKRMEQTHEGNK